ncbi:hypothetical protein [uncultured Thiodictyon sp.]|jgi:hypothetical protein|uniref:hypothetical protein n=1 Tax=uncultured Thiodictyon sp. TaxID=1846217 RepID=UPI0025E05429|nr:hypothetical protein [uncultured Thiodictyon sp.]
MGHPISVRLDEDIQLTLEDAARERGVGLSTYLREVAATEAKRLRRERIRAQSRTVGAYVEACAEAREFYSDWGTPSGEGQTR